MVGALHAAGIEVILDIVPNHTARAASTARRCRYRGLDAPSYYSLGGNGHDADITGCGNTLDSGSPTVIRLVCDAMRHWVDRVRCRRVPHRPRERARPPALRLVRPERPAAHRDRRRPGAVAGCKLIAEPWDATGEGYRVGGFGVAVVGVERALPRRRPRLLAGPRRHRRAGVAAHRQLRPLRRLRTAAVGVGQLRHRARRVHPARPRLLRAQAQRGQRREQPRRHRRQPLAELRGRGRDGVTGRGRRQRTGHGPRAAGHAAALHGHADAAGRRRALAHPGRQQQRLLPGRRDVLGGLGGRGGGGVADGVRGAARRRSAARRPTLHRDTLLPRRRGALVAPRRARGSAATTGTTAGCAPSACCAANGCCCCTRAATPIAVHAAARRPVRAASSTAPAPTAPR